MKPHITTRDATRIQGRRVSPTAPADGQALVYQAAGGLWLPGAAGAAPDDPAAVSMLDTLASEVTVTGSGPLTYRTFTVPGGTLAADGDTLELWAVVSRGSASGGQTTRLEVLFGGLSLHSTTLVDDTDPNNQTVLRLLLQRRGAASLGVYGDEVTIDDGVTTNVRVNTSVAPNLAAANDLVLRQPEGGAAGLDATLHAYSLIRTNAP